MPGKSQKCRKMSIFHDFREICIFPQNFKLFTTCTKFRKMSAIFKKEMYLKKKIKYQNFQNIAEKSRKTMKNAVKSRKSRKR